MSNPPSSEQLPVEWVSKETIRKRLKIYIDSTSPVLEYYKDKRKVTEIDGVGEIDEIYSKILNIL